MNIQIQLNIKYIPKYRYTCSYNEHWAEAIHKQAGCNEVIKTPPLPPIGEAKFKPCNISFDEAALEISLEYGNGEIVPFKMLSEAPPTCKHRRGCLPKKNRLKIHKMVIRPFLHQQRWNSAVTSLLMMSFLVWRPTLTWCYLWPLPFSIALIWCYFMHWWTHFWHKDTYITRPSTHKYAYRYHCTYIKHKNLS